MLAGSSLEQQAPVVLYPLLSALVDSEHNEAAAMVIDAILLSTPDETPLIQMRAALEATFEPHKALQSFSEYFQLGGGDAVDFVTYSRLLLHVNDPTTAADALGHALARCEPSERFNVLVKCARCKEAMNDRPGALRHLAEADTLGLLDFDDVMMLAELYSTHGDVATAVATFDRAAVMEPSNARVRQQRGACKGTLGDNYGAIADLDAAILLGLDNALTYNYRGTVNMELSQPEAALADFEQAVVKQSDPKGLHDALADRAAIKYLLGDFQDATADMQSAHAVSPLSDLEQLSKVSNLLSSIYS